MIEIDSSQQFSVVTCKLSNNTEVTFESDENDFDAGFVLESDEDICTISNILPQLESTLINSRSISPSDKSVRVVDNELPSTCRNNSIFPADFNNDVVLESEEEELEENALCLPHLGRISNDASLYCRHYLAVSAFQPKYKSICLETTIPPLTTRTAGEIPKQQMMFCAKTVAKGGANASVTLYVGSGASFCQLKTTINNPDSYGIYWCPFPMCNKKSRKKSALRDHLKKSHHGPFYCMECGSYFLQMPSLNRHFRQRKHSQQDNLLTKETTRHYTVSAVKRFYVCMYEAFAASAEYTLS